MLNLIKSITVDHIPKDVTRLFVSAYPSWLLGYLVWLLNKSPELNHLKYFGDLSLPRKIALIVLKIWNLIKNGQRTEGRTFDLEICISHSTTEMMDQLSRKYEDSKGWMRSRWYVAIETWEWFGIIKYAKTRRCRYSKCDILKGYSKGCRRCYMWDTYAEVCHPRLKFVEARERWEVTGSHLSRKFEYCAGVIPSRRRLWFGTPLQVQCLKNGEDIMHSILNCVIPTRNLEGEKVGTYQPVTW